MSRRLQAFCTRVCHQKSAYQRKRGAVGKQLPPLPGQNDRRVLILTWAVPNTFSSPLALKSGCDKTFSPPYREYKSECANRDTILTGEILITVCNLQVSDSTYVWPRDQTLVSLGPFSLFGRKIPEPSFFWSGINLGPIDIDVINGSNGQAFR